MHNSWLYQLLQNSPKVQTLGLSQDVLNAICVLLTKFSILLISQHIQWKEMFNQEYVRNNQELIIKHLRKYFTTVYDDQVCFERVWEYMQSSDGLNASQEQLIAQIQVFDGNVKPQDFIISDVGMYQDSMRTALALFNASILWHTFTNVLNLQDEGFELLTLFFSDNNQVYREMLSNGDIVRSIQSVSALIFDLAKDCHYQAFLLWEMLKTQYPNAPYIWKPHKKS